MTTKYIFRHDNVLIKELSSLPVSLNCGDLVKFAENSNRYNINHCWQEFEFDIDGNVIERRVIYDIHLIQ